MEVKYFDTVVLVTEDTKELYRKLDVTYKLRGWNSYTFLQPVLQRWIRENFNLDIVPLRVASALDQKREWVLYLNGREYYHDGIKVLCADYETCLEIGLQLMLKKIIDEKLQPII